MAMNDQDRSELAGEMDEEPGEAGGTVIEETAAPLTEIGKISFKKFGRFLKKNPLTAALAVTLPPVAAFKLLRDGRRKRPVAIAKVQAIKAAAAAGNPEAKQAYAALAMANEAEKAGVNPADEYPDYPADDVPYEDYMAEQLNEPGEENVGSLWSALKKIGPALDISNPKNPLRSAVSSIPFVGSGVLAASDMLAKAKSGSKAAIDKINEVKRLAKAGNPTAGSALANLHTANALDKAAEAGALAAGGSRKVYDWMPGINAYRAGTHKEIVMMGPEPKAWFPFSALRKAGIRKGTGLKVAKT